MVNKVKQVVNVFAGDKVEYLSIEKFDAILRDRYISP